MKKFVDRVLLILNILASLGLLLSYLAPFINPAKFFLPALFGLVYPYLVLFNLIFIIYWLIRLKKEVAISIIVILLGWNNLNNLLPLNFKETNIPESTSAERMLKVLSYNVRGFDIYEWTSNPQAKQGIFGFIEQQKPDILCFQEYYTSSNPGESHDDLSKRLKSLPQSAVYYTTDKYNRNGFGIATYSRFPIIKKSRIPFNDTFNAAMYTDILFQSDTIRVFNIHLQSIRFLQENYAFMDTASLKYANDQMREIRAIGSVLKNAFEMRSEQANMISNYVKDSPYPVIVLGDLNDTPQSYAYRKIRKGMHDAFRKTGRGIGNTYSGKLPSFRIDYIMYNNPFSSYQFKRIKTDYSDHYPISTWLYLPDKTSAE